MTNRDTVQEIYAAFGRGDIPAILETMGDDVAWEHQPISTDVPYLQARRGRAGVLEFFQTVAAELQFTKVDVKAVIDGAKIVVALVDIDVIVKRTGKSVREVDEAHIWHFDDRGKVAKFRHCHDTHAHYLAWQK
jgi:uncharacterized protein